jgi:regulator of protease activity HflC (stomatin/prohibitin superfamily)
MWLVDAAIGFGIIVALVGMYLASCIRILNEYERGVIFRLGRARPKPKGPGLILVFHPVDRMVRVDLRTITKVIEPQDIITKDNVSVRVNAVLYFRVMDPMRSVLEVADFLFATSQVALTTLRSTLGQAELDDLLTERDKVNRRLQEIIDGHTEPWGVKVSVVEVKDVDLPEPMKRSMAHQAEAERDRRAKVINAEGEFQAADKLRQAAEIMTPYPMAMQMRYLQTLTEVASERNSTIIFPLPIELLAPFLKTGQEHASAATPMNGKLGEASLGLKNPAQAEPINGAGATLATARGHIPSGISTST